MAEKDEEQEVQIAPDEDVEVQIEEENAEKPEDEAAKEEGEKKADEEKAAKPKKKHRGGNANQRINALWAQVQEKDVALEQQRLRAESAEAARVKTEGIAGQSIEENLNSQKELLTYRLKDASIEGDAEKIAKLTSEIAQVEARRAQMERWKMENSVKPEKKQEIEQKPAQATSFDAIYDNSTPVGKAWMDNHREWLDSESDSYNDEMRADVVTKAQNLERDWARQGRASDIGTRAYYRELDNYIRDNWSDEEEAPVTKKTNGYAAPVSQRQAPGQPTVKQRNIVTLTKDERDIAINLTRKHADGREFTDAEKIKEFAQSKEMTKGMKPNEPITIHTIRRGA